MRHLAFTDFVQKYYAQVDKGDVDGIAPSSKLTPSTFGLDTRISAEERRSDHSNANDRVIEGVGDA
jgi:hypothetical protein